MSIKSKKFLLPVGILATIALLGGAYIFQPWKLFVDTEVQESLPTVEPSAEVTTEASDRENLPSEPTDTEPIVLAAGTLISHEHETSGRVKILKLADGTRVLRLEDLDTSDGPKVEVWLTDAPVIEGQEGWRVFDDSVFASIGPLKGNQGNQNYEIPADLDLSDFSSVSLWCVTFGVSFGAAELVSG